MLCVAVVGWLMKMAVATMVVCAALVTLTFVVLTAVWVAEDQATKHFVEPANNAIARQSFAVRVASMLMKICRCRHWKCQNGSQLEKDNHA